ncbi:LPS export ABC transporter permease LptF [Rubellimicrobium sp. CFH 75288]|uniref:LPS export ABC transporter permease LptF n=1 Tax=Rubellimicrobium sp. CFH 75288 TaxID=2697034 RepID=UPI001412E78C|nr:LPS export ABC transporter permease LptF [Rubellimicrobium sp. CFH 75288]NAZ35408.1 LPS export ABC transporter permease LptF [Rubellimicrobium sp. CFH 75288]
MGRIDRYILWQFMLVFGLTALVLVMIYWVNRAVVLFDQLISDGQSAWVFLEFTALALPGVVKLVLPLAAFVAALVALNRLTGDSEFVVLQATGASPWRLARPVLAFGLIVMALMSVLSHGLVPASIGRIDSRQAEIAETATARLLREGEFVSPVPGVTLYIASVSAQGELRGLLLSDSREGGEPTTYTASHAYLVRGEGGPQLVMVDGQMQRIDPRTGGLLVTRYADLVYDLSPLLPSGGSDARSWREVGTLELLRPTPALEAETGRSAARLRAEGHNRMAETLLAPVAALLALAAMLQGGFSRFGAWKQVALGILLAIAVKAVEAVALQAARDDPALWPLVYAPALFGLAVGALLLARAARPWRRAGRADPAEAPA